MSEILDQGEFWKLVLDENVIPIEEINRPKKGYYALIGINRDTELETISYVKYKKQYINIDGISITRSKDYVEQKVDDLKKYKLNQ